MTNLSIPVLTLVTIVTGAACAMVMFKLYHLCLMGFIRSMGWTMESLKDYPVTPVLKRWDFVAQAIIIMVIIWRVNT